MLKHRIGFLNFIWLKKKKRERKRMPVIIDSFLCCHTKSVATCTNAECTSNQKSIARSIFLNLRNFGTDRYTSEKYEIKSLDLQEIDEFDFSFFVVSRFVPKLRKFKKIGAYNTFLTARIHNTKLEYGYACV